MEIILIVINFIYKLLLFFLNDSNEEEVCILECKNFEII